MSLVQSFTRAQKIIVEQVKRWLKCTGIKLSGKRDELIAHVHDCVNSRNHHVLDPSIDGGKWIDIKQQSNDHKTDKMNSSKSSQVKSLIYLHLGGKTGQVMTFRLSLTTDMSTFMLWNHCHLTLVMLSTIICWTRVKTRMKDLAI